MKTLVWGSLLKYPYITTDHVTATEEITTTLANQNGIPVSKQKSSMSNATRYALVATWRGYSTSSLTVLFNKLDTNRVPVTRLLLVFGLDVVINTVEVLVGETVVEIVVNPTVPDKSGKTGAV